MNKAQKALKQIRETSVWPNDYEFSRRTTSLGQSVLTFDDDSRLIVGIGGVWTWEEFFGKKSAA